MKTSVKITADKSTGEILVDGEANQIVYAYTGQDLVLDVDLEDVLVIGDQATVWVTVDQEVTDLKVTSDGGDSFYLPSTSTLNDEPLGSQAGVIPRAGGQMMANWSKAKLDTIKSLKRFPYTGAKHGLYENVMICANGFAYKCPDDFRIEPSNNGNVIVRLESHAVHKAGIKYFIKHRVPEWVKNNGQRRGQIIVSPFQDVRFKTVWIHINGYDTLPIKLVVKSEPVYQTSVTLENRMPSSIVEEGKGLVSYLKDFYDYADRKGGAYDTIYTLNEIRDPFKTAPYNLSKLMVEYASFLPNWAPADRELILKHSMRFYENRGNDKSWNFLARAIFNVDAFRTYPNEQMLRGSDSDWRQYTTIKGVSIRRALTLRPDLSDSILKTLGYQFNLPDFIGSDECLTHLEGTRIQGLVSRAEAIIENVSQSIYNGVVITEFQLSDVHGEFCADELVFPKEGLNFDLIDKNQRSLANFHFLVANQIVGIPCQTLADDQKFAPGTPVRFEPSQGSALVLEVDDYGHPIKYEILDSGFVSGSTVVGKITTIDGEEVVVNLNINPQLEHPGYWKGGSSFASNNYYRTQDGFYYQTFSYDVHMPIEEVQHKEHFQSQLHITGYQMFSTYTENTTIASSAIDTKIVAVTLPKNRRSIYVGDIKDAVLQVYLAGQLLRPSEWTIVGSGIRTFVQLLNNVETEMRAIVSVRTNAAIRSMSNLYPENTQQEVMETLPLEL